MSENGSLVLSSSLITTPGTVWDRRNSNPAGHAIHKIISRSERGRQMNTQSSPATVLRGLDLGMLSILPEPPLEFRHGQGLTDPRNGLALFGPWDADSPSRPGNISYGVIGTAEGIAKFHRFARLLEVSYCFESRGSSSPNLATVSRIRRRVRYELANRGSVDGSPRWRRGPRGGAPR